MKMILHVGTHKTGTSSIQAFLEANREGLRAAGYHYPASCSVFGGNHSPLCDAIVPDPDDDKQNQETQIIDLTIEDTDPQRAADIANILVEVLIGQNESLQAGRYASTESSIRAQSSPRWKSRSTTSNSMWIKFPRRFSGSGD